MPRLKNIPPQVFSHTSKYAQRMRKLSCKIFNEFYVPELTKKELEYGPHHPPVQSWNNNWFSEFRTWSRHQEKPFDLDEKRNMQYYPAQPQFRLLSDQLRKYGLFRDEHRDFNEEMKAIAISRGKVFRERRGPSNKTDKKKK